jgi:hypothetical protein
MNRTRPNHEDRLARVKRQVSVLLGQRLTFLQAGPTTVLVFRRRDASVRIGIVADIHEAIEPLQRALLEFRSRGVDQVVSLGDACDTFSPVGRAGEVVALLRGVHAIGVWGNHDFGLCYEVPEKLRQQTDAAALEYMGTIQPHLVIDGCRFSHVEPWLDAHTVENLWYYDGPPDTPEKAGRSFTAVPERRLFMGHFHRWLVMTPEGRVEWNGEGPLTLSQEQKYLVVVAPVFGGWCAVYDTVDSKVTPVRCAV